MLERQHTQLIAGVQELYRRVQIGQGCQGEQLQVENYDQPLTHEILEGLGLLQADDWDDIDGYGGSCRSFKPEPAEDGLAYTPMANTPLTPAKYSPSIETLFAKSEIMSKRRRGNQGAIQMPQKLTMPPFDMNCVHAADAAAYDRAMAIQVQMQTGQCLTFDPNILPSIDLDLTCGMDSLGYAVGQEMLSGH